MPPDSSRASTSRSRDRFRSAASRAARSASRTALVASVSLGSLAATGVLSPAFGQDAPPAQTLPGTNILPGGRWTGARLPTVAQGNNGLVMTIQQEQKAALLDWSRFDVAASEEVRFEQGGADWIALNRIFSADPSKIAGKITGDAKLETEGKAQKVKGAGQDVKGSVKGALGDDI